MKYYHIKKSIKHSNILIETAFSIFFCIIIACNNNNSNAPIDEYNTWTFSGYVVDGYTGEPLVNVSIFYCLESGQEIEYNTSPTGNFYINNLPFGEKNFRFVYNNSTDSMYTEKLMVVSNVSSMAAPEGELADASKIVKLFPLKGSLTGKVFIKLRESGLTIPAESTMVRVTFNDTDYANSTPSIFATFCIYAKGLKLLHTYPTI